LAETALHLQDLHKAYGERVLLGGAELAVQVGEKIGLIGDNGSGKSTLLHILAGRTEPDAGSLSVRRDARIALLEQVPALDEAATARQVLEELFVPVLDAIEAYERAAEALDPTAEALLEEIERLGGWDWEHRLRRAADEAGVEDLRATVATLSGGERRRLALARLDLQAPDLMLLDEPTNHLDADSVERLEDWLEASRATCVISTHDRYFLERVVDRIVELRDGRLRTYRGGYSDYLAARAREEALRERVRKRRLQLLQGELEWARRAPKARGGKSRARLDRIENEQAEVEQLRAAGGIGSVQFGAGPRLGKTVLELDGVTKAFGGEPPVVDGLSLKLVRGERWGIVGLNGCGKTTLLRLVAGTLEPDEGRIVRGVNTRHAYYEQHRTELCPTDSLRAALSPDGDWVFPGGHKVHVASWLTRFAFPSRMHDVAVANLSGGERNRLALARFMLSDANLLLLDEPTSELDLLTLRVFEEALAVFPGCVLVVTHDRFFLDKVATGVLGFGRTPGSAGNVAVCQGGYAQLRRLREAAALEARAAETERARAARATRTRPTKRGGLTYLEKEELAGMEARIESEEAAVAHLEEAYADPAVWQDGATLGLELQRKLDVARATVEGLYVRWEELAERAEE